MWMYLAIGAAILAIVGGGYLWLDHTLSSKDAQITSLQSELGAAKSDLVEAKNTIVSKEKEINRIRADLVSSQAQALRIKQQDATERLHQTEVERKVEGINSRNPANLDNINRYQECVSRDITDSKCADLLQ